MVRAWAGPPLLAIVSGEAARDKLGCAPTCNMQHATFEAARCALRARLCAWPLAHLSYARGMTCAHAAQPQICGRECARCRATAAQPQRCGQASLIKGLARQRLAWRIVGSVDSRAETRRQSAEGYRRNQTRAQTPKPAALPRRLAPPCCGGARVDCRVGALHGRCCCRSSAPWTLPAACCSTSRRSKASSSSWPSARSM